MDFYMGQILPVAFTYAPKQTALCTGQTLPVSQYAALYALLGNSFGGNSTSFGLPNTMGRTLVGFGNRGSVMPLGTVGGEVTHQLQLAEMPQHTHALYATNGGTPDSSPEGNLPASANTPTYGAVNTMVPLSGAPLANQGGGQDHPNLQPAMPINFAIVLYGIYPSRS